MLRPIAALATLAGMIWAGVVLPTGGFAPARGLALAGLALVATGAGFKQDFVAVLGLWLLLTAFVIQHEAGWQPLLGRPAALLAFGRLSYAFYMSFAVAELLLVNLFRQRSWVPAEHKCVFAGGMFTMTLVLAMALSVIFERKKQALFEKSAAGRRRKGLLFVNKK